MTPINQLPIQCILQCSDTTTQPRLGEVSLFSSPGKAAAISQRQKILRQLAFPSTGLPGEGVQEFEAARVQGRYVPVLEAVLDAQPQWASHGAPNIKLAWVAAALAGLDVEQARRDMQTPKIIDVARIDAGDVQALGVRKTPTFFVNGKPLERFGMQQLYDMVQREVESVAN